MRSLILAAVFAALAVAVPLSSAPGVRSVVRVNVTNADVAAALEGSMVWTESGIHIGGSVDVVASSETLSRLSAMNAELQVMMPDMDAVIAEQQAQFENRHNAADYNANYHSVEEITERPQVFSNNFENVDFIESIGQSLEGRKIPAIRFGSKTKSAEGKVPTVWLECNIHAREWITGATCMYMAQKLLEGAKTDYKDIFETLQFYLAPAINPDGLVYSQTKDRMWRKNRRLNKDGTYGVDLNRNFGNHWGEGGASTVPSSETYRGPSAFSEPESTNIKTYLKSLEESGSQIEAAIDFHSYSQLLLRPYGWTTPEKSMPANEAELRKLTDEMRDIIKSVHGTVFTSEHAAELYVASGIAADWLAADATKQNKGLTYELRDTGRYGFLLPADQIIPSGEEILPSVVHYARSVLQEVVRRQTATL